MSRLSITHLGSLAIDGMYSVGLVCNVSCCYSALVLVPEQDTKKHGCEYHLLCIVYLHRALELKLCSYRKKSLHCLHCANSHW